jgi:hypothetical protein
MFLNSRMIAYTCPAIAMIGQTITTSGFELSSLCFWKYTMIAIAHSAWIARIQTTPWTAIMV